MLAVNYLAILATKYKVFQDAVTMLDVAEISYQIRNLPRLVRAPTMADLQPKSDIGDGIPITKKKITILLEDKS